MTRIILLIIIIAILSVGVPVRGQDTAPDEVDRIKDWLEKNDLEYEVTDFGGFAFAFEAEKAPVVEIHIDVSPEFIHFSSPVGTLPDDLSKDYYVDLIVLTGAAPMLKPIIDEDGFFYLTIDLPRIALNEDEFMSDIILLVNFVDDKYDILHPWNEE